MPLTDHIGLTGPNYEVDIERGKIREFARAMQAPLPEFCSGRHPVVPATFLVSAPYTWGYTLERPRGTVFADIGHDLTVSLHAGETFRFLGPPPRAGDRLTARAMLEDVWTKPGRTGGDLTFLRMLTTYRDAAGEILVEQRSTSVTTTSRPSQEGWAPTIPDYDPDYTDLEPPSPFGGITRANPTDLRVGDSPGDIDLGPLSLRDIVRFQGVVGEDDPLHHDTAWAAKQGYPSVFGLGTHLASLLAAYAAYWIDPALVRRFDIRFREVAWPGDRLTCGGKVTQIDTAEPGGICIQLACCRSDGKPLVTAELVCAFPA